MYKFIFNNLLFEKTTVTIQGLEDPASILQCELKNFESKKLEACTKLANFIINTYNNSLRSRVITEIMRRSQFRYLLAILEGYEILQIYCNLSQERERGITVKSQAIKLIVKQSKQESGNAPSILTKTISKLIKGAVRIRRLLELTENNFNIVDAFPDLEVGFFTGTRLSAINFEIWLKLVEKNVLISAKEGRRLYDKYKASARKMRLKNLLSNKKRK